MKKRLWLIPLALLLAISLVAMGCPAEEVPPPPPEEEEEVPPPPPTKDKIVIGQAVALTGPLAENIHLCGPDQTQQLWIDEVNAEGGIYVEEYGKKLPIERIQYDDTSDMGTMTRLLEKLIVEDKVDFIMPPCSTAMLFGAAPIANKYGYILMGNEGGATTIMDMLPGLPYFFGVLNFSNWNQIPVFADLAAAKGAKTAAIIYIADLHGIEYSGVAGIEFDRVGIDVVMLKSSIPYTADLELLLKEARDSKADILCSFTYPPTTWMAVSQSIALGYSPKAIILGPGGYNFYLRDMVGAEAIEGVVGEGAWSPKQSAAAKAFYDKLIADYGGLVAVDLWGNLFYYGGWQFFGQAIEKAGTLDQSVIREVMATQTFDTCLGPTWFTQFGNGGCLLAVECHPGQIGQWQNGEWEVIGPEEKATADFIYPKPPWP